MQQQESSENLSLFVMAATEQSNLWTIAEHYWIKLIILQTIGYTIDIVCLYIVGCIQPPWEKIRHPGNYAHLF
jgi:hypothetical protein